MRLLIAEDDRALGTFLVRGLESDGHEVALAADGAQAVAAFRQQLPDLTILDLNLPILDGEDVLRAVRAIEPDLPILVLTARTGMETRIRCLDAGADDLMGKPFSLYELRARCRALLRRRREARLLLRAGDLELNRLDHTARRDGKTIELTNKEFALLESLMLRPGHCVSRVELLDTVWHMDPAQTTNIVDVYVNYLRRKLNDAPPGRLIRTVRGQGYMVAAGVDLECGSGQASALHPGGGIVASPPATSLGAGQSALLPAQVFAVPSSSQVKEASAPCNQDIPRFAV
jgi:DNA-binding response OmpR family regulator